MTTSSAAGEVAARLRDLAPRVLAALVRRYGDFETCEDAVQEALLAAATQWPVDGEPANPLGWLVTVASRRRVELWRADSARERRELAAARLEPPSAAAEDAGGVGGVGATAVDDTLTLLLLCCHPALSDASAIALTLRAVGGLSTAEIASAFLVPEPTMGQRISRAKKTVLDAGATFAMPPPDQRPRRIAALLHVLYLIFNEGYTASSGAALHRAELTGEAIRLTRQVHAMLPEDGEVAGLLALMLLTDARRPARTRPDGGLVTLAEQDRTRWDRSLIAEGLALIADALSRTPIGRYQLQAAIAAVHDEAPSAGDTDWPQILGLYDLLRELDPAPMVLLNRIVALAMVHGPRAGLAELDAAGAHPALAGHHRLHAVRAHLLDLAGERDAARDAYRRAAESTRSEPERRYLEARAGSSTVDPG